MVVGGRTSARYCASMQREVTARTTSLPLERVQVTARTLTDEPSRGRAAIGRRRHLARSQRGLCAGGKEHQRQTAIRDQGSGRPTTRACTARKGFRRRMRTLGAP